MRPLRATIHPDALRHNLAVARKHAPQSKVLAVVKANGYGHGLERVVRALADADGLALLELDAAVRLREAGYAKRIVLLEGFFEPAELAVLDRYRIGAAVHDAEQVSMLERYKAGAPLDILLKVNTGMNRLGFAPEAAAAALARLEACSAVGPVTLMTHFAEADDVRGVAWQLDRFEAALGGRPHEKSFANSAAILRYPETHHDWVRPGIMLYGSSPFTDASAAALRLRPAMTLASRLIAVRELVPGDRVGYGGTFTADQPMRIGVVACGYADGYPRHAPTGTPVSVGGTLTRTVGRVSMDMLCVDLTPVPQARVGTPVELWGAACPIDEVARAAGTVSYELMCALAARVPVGEDGGQG